ncbi:MAG TPA: hypothetical protein DHV84_06045 [Desulfotomaculum sp.]|nr:hypothetical protein [Desulfotomaculum sp.]
MVDLSQVFLNSLVTGSLYLLAGTGLTLTYGLSRFPNFAYAEFITLGGFIGYVLVEQKNTPFLLAFLVAFIVAGLISALAYGLIFQPLVRRKASLIHLMVASIGLGYILRYGIGEIWGWSALSFTISWPLYDVNTVRITGLWLWLIFTAVILGLVLHALLTGTKIGKAIRGIATNPELALVSGVNVERVIFFTWFIGAGLAAAAGIFRGADARLTPMLGWDILLPIFAASVLGGIGNFYGLIIAAYILGLAENFGVIFLTVVGLSTEYRMAIAFLILIIVLLVKPQGLGKK